MTNAGPYLLNPLAKSTEKSPMVWFAKSLRLRAWKCLPWILAVLGACGGSGGPIEIKQDASVVRDVALLHNDVMLIGNDAAFDWLGRSWDAKIADHLSIDVAQVADALIFQPDGKGEIDSTLSIDTSSGMDRPFNDDLLQVDAPMVWDLNVSEISLLEVDSLLVDVRQDLYSPDIAIAFCTGESTSSLCSRKNKQCGSYQGPDNCDRPRAVDCGTCNPGLKCNEQNQCVCVPESDASFCTRFGKNCGAFTGHDNCGRLRTVAGCGSCQDNLACTHDVCVEGICRYVNRLACTQSCSSPISCNLTDSDGDGLNDVWEENGYVDVNCNGRYSEGIDTPLPDADKNTPNIYVKWDYMNQSIAPAHSHKPSVDEMASAVSILQSHNIILRFYPMSDEIPEVRVVSVSPADQLVADCVGNHAISFDTIKAAHFPAFLSPAYHYALFAHNHTCSVQTNCSACPVNLNSTEIPVADSTGVAIMPGRDFIVSLGYWNDIGAPAPGLWKIGSFLHQLGHNMGLGHGGGDHLDRKPNYISLMNSNYQFGMPVVSPWDPNHPWSLQYQNPAAGFALDFSTFTAPTLHEGRDEGNGMCGVDDSGGLNETEGVLTPPDFPDIAISFSSPDTNTYYGPSGGNPIDWDLSSDATDQHVYRDISGDGQCTDLPGFNDMERMSTGPGITKMAHLNFNQVCAPGMWTNGMTPTP